MENIRDDKIIQEDELIKVDINYFIDDEDKFKILLKEACFDGISNISGYQD